MTTKNPSRLELRYEAINLVLSYRAVLGKQEFTDAMERASSIYPSRLTKTDGGEEETISLPEYIFGDSVGLLEESFALHKVKENCLTDDSVPKFVRKSFVNNIVTEGLTATQAKSDFESLKAELSK